MKKGAIVCVVGAMPDRWSRDNESDFRRLTAKFEAIRIVTPQTSQMIVRTMWLKMVSKGITDVVVAVVKVDDHGEMEYQEVKETGLMVGMS